jgi:hypothetical protein
MQASTRANGGAFRVMKPDILCQLEFRESEAVNSARQTFMEVTRNCASGWRESVSGGLRESDGLCRRVSRPYANGAEWFSGCFGGHRIGQSKRDQSKDSCLGLCDDFVFTASHYKKVEMSAVAGFDMN